MPSVRPVTVPPTVVAVLAPGTSAQVVPPSVLYCHLVMAPAPVTAAADRVSLPLPAPAVAVGLLGLPGLVRNAEAAASSLASVQPLSLYAL